MLCRQPGFPTKTQTLVENTVLFYNVHPSGYFSLFIVLFPPIFCCSHKLFDILILSWIGSALPLLGVSAHLFGINAGVPSYVELVLI
jgi:hypothetical protein